MLLKNDMVQNTSFTKISESQQNINLHKNTDLFRKYNSALTWKVSDKNDTAFKSDRESHISDLYYVYGNKSYGA